METKLQAVKIIFIVF